jgi:hypothetical protein
MKTEEDEAWEEMERRQGAGGFPAKRAMAADKSQENVPLYVSKTTFRSWSEFASDYERGFIDGMQKQSASFSNGRRWGKTSLIGLLEKRMPMARIKELEAQLAQPAQEQRPWVGLTDDELADLWYKESLDWMEFARAHEAALKEKNNG